MSEADQRRLTDATEKFVQSIYSSRLRGISKSCILKAASCYDEKVSMQQSHQCHENAMMPMQAMNQILQESMNQMQNRLQRCTMECQDSTNDKFSEMNPAAEKHFYSCTSTCIDKHIALLKSVQGRVEQDIDQLMSKVPK